MSDPITICLQQNPSPRLVQVLEQKQTSGSFSGEETIFDSVCSVSSGSATWSDWDITPDVFDSGDTVTVTNQTTSIASLEMSSGVYHLTRTTNGVAKVSVTSGNYTRNLRLNVTQRTGVTAYQFLEFDEDSIADTITTQIKTRALSGKDLNFFSTYNHSTPQFTKNANCWAAGIDFTGVGLGTDILGSFTSANRGFAVTDQHFVGARHWTVTSPQYAAESGFLVGNQVRFLASNGDIITKTIVGTSASANAGDIIVGTLDSALPAGVSPVPLVGSWLAQGAEFMDSGELAFYAAGLCFQVAQNHNIKVVSLPSLTEKSKRFIGSSSYTVSGRSYSRAFCEFLPIEVLEQSAPDLLGQSSAFYGTGVGGDSGGPIGVIIDGEIAVLSEWTTPTSGPFYGYDNGGLMNALIAVADADAVTRESLESPTGKAVTIISAP